MLRREQTLEHGATHAFDPKQLDVPEAVLKATGGLGVDIAFDAAGVQASIDTALGSLRPRGVLMNIAIWDRNATVDMNTIVMKEIIVTGEMPLVPEYVKLLTEGLGPAAYDRVHSELLEVIAAGKIPGLESLITRKVALEDVVESGFNTLLNDKDAHGEFELAFTHQFHWTVNF